MAFGNMPKYIFKNILLPFVVLLKIIETKANLKTPSTWLRVNCPAATAAGAPGARRGVRTSQVPSAASAGRVHPSWLKQEEAVDRSHTSSCLEWAVLGLGNQRPSDALGVQVAPRFALPSLVRQLLRSWGRDAAAPSAPAAHVTCPGTGRELTTSCAPEDSSSQTGSRVLP